jgi:membrane protein involved in colicin uptake
MVPSENPVFLDVTTGEVLGKPKAAGGATSSVPRLLTPADATVAEAVDNASVGTDLPIAPGPDYDPAAVDAATAQAAAANADALAAEEKAAAEKAAAAKKTGKKAKNPAAENNLWQDSTIIDVTAQVSSEDAGLVAVPVE